VDSCERPEKCAACLAFYWTTGPANGVANAPFFLAPEPPPQAANVAREEGGEAPPSTESQPENS
jgi:hypothetical protein